MLEKGAADNSKKVSAGIIGMGIGLPRRLVTNKDLEKIIDTSDEWIRSRTGISSRFVIDDDQNISDLAAAAGTAAIADAGLTGDDIDMILVATGSPELIWPSTACLTQAKMGLKGQPAFDISAACTGFAYGLSIAEKFATSGAYRNILLIGAEAMTRFVNWQDRTTCILFGDAAAAAVITPGEYGYGFLASYLGADGAGAGLLRIPTGGSAQTCARTADPSTQSIVMNGSEIFKFAVRVIPECIEKVAAMAGINVEDIDYFIPHQANQRITESAAQRMHFSGDQIVSNIDRYGNTGAASIPLALAELKAAGKLKRGDIIVMVAFGAGLTWGANIIRWQE